MAHGGQREVDADQVPSGSGDGAEDRNTDDVLGRFDRAVEVLDEEGQGSAEYQADHTSQDQVSRQGSVGWVLWRGGDLQDLHGAGEHQLAVEFQPSDVAGDRLELGVDELQFLGKTVVQPADLDLELLPVAIGCGGKLILQSIQRRSDILATLPEFGETDLESGDGGTDAFGRLFPAKSVLAQLLACKAASAAVLAQP